MPTVKTSEMSELLDSLTTIVGRGLPEQYVKREVMAVARKALKLHQQELAAANARVRELETLLHRGCKIIGDISEGLATNNIHIDGPVVGGGMNSDGEPDPPHAWVDEWLHYADNWHKDTRTALAKGGEGGGDG